MIENIFDYRYTRKDDSGIRKLFNITQLKDKKEKYNDYKIQTFDIETWGLNPSNLALACFFDGEDYYNFYNKEEVINYLDDIKQNTLIYAHNGARFDMVMFFDEILYNPKWSIKKTGQIYHFSFTNAHNKEIKFKDSYYILPSSLKNLAKDLLKEEEQKLTLDEKFKNPENWGFDKTEYLKDIRAYNKKHITQDDLHYCQRDVYSLYKIINHQIFRDYGFDFKNENTIASIAYNKLLLNSSNLIVNLNIDKEFISLYNGGLTDVYMHTNTKKEILCLDYNSFYPHCMTLGFGNPYFLERHYFELLNEETREKELIKFWEMLEKYPNGFSEVSLKVKDKINSKNRDIISKIPLFPLLGMNHFNLEGGVFKISIMNVELVNLREFFDIEVLYSVYSDVIIYPFKSYILDIYKKRLEAKQNKDNSLALILKLLMNSGYGRTGLKTQSEGIIEGSYEFIKEFLNKKLSQGIEREQSLGYTYIRELTENRFTKLKEMFENGNDDLEILNYIKTFIRDINVDDQEGFSIKNINRIPREILKDEQEDIYILSYTTKKQSHIESCYYLASEITSKARAILIRDMIEIERSGLGSVCYTDTDSLHIETDNKEELLKFLSPKISDFELGKLKNEGVYHKGFWLSKKHYYLFKKDDSNRLIFEKMALKGFTCNSDLDYFLHTQPSVFINKIYSRIANVNLTTNTLIEEKTFLNFVTKRDKENRLLKLVNKEQHKDIKLEHSLFIKDFFFKMLEENELYITHKNEIVRVTKNLINQGIISKKADFLKAKESGVFDYEFDSLTIANKALNKKLQSYVKVNKTKKPKAKRVRDSNKKRFLEFLA